MSIPMPLRAQRSNLGPIEIASSPAAPRNDGAGGT
jgi:hypothetical protein